MKKKNNHSAPLRRGGDEARANPCQKYGIAITDYVLSEPMDISFEELLNHLKECAACRKDLADWKSTYAALRTEAYHKTPEAKRRYQELLEKIKTLPVSPSHPPSPRTTIDTRWEIGSVAGKIYNILKENGEMPIPLLIQKSGLKEYHVQQGIGWLAGQEKILMSRDEHTAYVALRPPQ